MLIENCPSLKEIDSKSTAMSVRLKSPAKIFGWDFGTAKEMFGEEWAREDLVPLQIEKEEILSKISDTTNEEDKTTLKERYKQISKIISNEARKAFSKAFSSGRGLNPSQHFNSRTKAMMTSIEKSSVEGRNVFLIAGECHFSKEAAKHLGVEQALTQFYEFIRSRQVVILKVKTEQGAEIAREELALIQEVQIAIMAEMLGLSAEKLQSQMTNSTENEDQSKCNIQ